MNEEIFLQISNECNKKTRIKRYLGDHNTISLALYRVIFYDLVRKIIMGVFVSGLKAGFLVYKLKALICTVCVKSQEALLFISQTL